MSNDIFEKIKKKVTTMISENKKLQVIMKRISKGIATFFDTSEYSNITSNILGSVFSEYVPELSSEGIKEDICTKLLRGQYADINEILAQVQTALDEETGIKIAPQKAEFPLERVQKAAHSLEDKTVTAETIARRAEACTVNISRSFHDDYMEENAKFRTDAGLKCYINRETDGNCCEWCKALAGRYEYDIFSMPEDIFRRHDNCGCTVTFENGRSRQNVWSKKTWEVHDAPENSAAPVVISPEKVKMLQEKNLPKSLTNGRNGGIIESELGKFKRAIMNDSQMSDDYYDALKNRFSHGSDNAKAVFNKYVHGDSVGNAYYMGTPHFDISMGKINMNYNLDLKNERGKCVTWFHEHGHYIDNAAGNISNNPEFRKLLGDDYLAYMKSYGKNNNLKTFDKVQAAISSDLDSMRKHSAVSDIMQGVSMGNIQGIAGHSYGYWKDDSVICSEAFAHMFESQFDQIRHKEMQKYFPNALRKFEEMIGGLL